MWDRQDLAGLRTNFRAIPPISVVSTFLKDDELSKKKKTFPGQDSSNLSEQTLSVRQSSLGNYFRPDAATSLSKHFLKDRAALKLLSAEHGHLSEQTRSQR